MKSNDSKTIYAYVRSKLHRGYVTPDGGYIRLDKTGYIFLVQEMFICTVNNI